MMRKRQSQMLSSAFSETSKQSVRGLKEYDDDEDNQENFQILLEINNGLVQHCWRSKRSGLCDL